MSFFSIFKRSRSERPSILRATATLYQDKIIIESTDTVKDGYGIASENLIVVGFEMDSASLGKVLRHHLLISRDNLDNILDFRQHYKEYLTRAGFKSGKEHHKNARQVCVEQRDQLITFYPTINGGFTGEKRGFRPADLPPLTIFSSASDEQLGESLQLAWTKCIDESA
jgi:hypothetical protein